MATRILAIASAALFVLAACGGSNGGEARYPSRENGCPVKSFPSDPSMQVDDLGTVTIDCEGGGSSCQRQLLDAVCQRGGDVAWGLADNALNATHLVAHAAHSKRVTKGARERGCAVQVFSEAPTVPTENIGPVAAVCSEDDTKDVCLRELEDQVCLLGGDALWQVEGPLRDGGRQHMRGRAAHTK